MRSSSSEQIPQPLDAPLAGQGVGRVHRERRGSYPRCRIGWRISGRTARPIERVGASGVLPVRRTHDGRTPSA